MALGGSSGAPSCLVLLLACCGEVVRAGASWRKDVRKAIARCSDYAKLKASGAAAAPELLASRDSARQAIWTAIMGNVVQHGSDREWQETIRTPAGPGNQFAKTSEFVRTCFAIGLIELRDTWGHYLERQAWAPGCLADFHRKANFEGQCFTATYGQVLNMFQWSGETDQMRRAYERAVEAFPRWHNVMMRPKMTIPDIRDIPVWEKGDDKGIGEMMDLLEQNIGLIKEELQVLKTGGQFSVAFDSLIGEGEWWKASLFQWAAREGPPWHDRCKLVPRLCDLFRPHFPQRRALPRLIGNQEEIVFFYGSPNSTVLPHNGGQNGRINIHIGVEGFEGSSINVFTDIGEKLTLDWSDSKAFAFNDGWAHEVVNGPGHRYVLALGWMHPDIDLHHFAEAFNEKTVVKRWPPRRMSQFQAAYRRKYGRDWEKEPIPRPPPGIFDPPPALRPASEAAHVRSGREEEEAYDLDARARARARARLKSPTRDPAGGAAHASEL